VNPGSLDPLLSLSRNDLMMGDCSWTKSGAPTVVDGDGGLANEKTVALLLAAGG